MSASRWTQHLVRLLRHPQRANLTRPPPPPPSTFRRTISTIKSQTANQQTPSPSPHPSPSAHPPRIWCLPLILPAGLFSFLAPRRGDDDAAENTPEGKLIMCIKRSILCIQRQQYDKAEQMLHLALRMAQDLQHAQGVTYVFDVMANLAMETEQYRKAEKLFVTVMQRLMHEGHKEDDIKMLHISSKIAQMEALQGNLQKAELGFKWVLDKVHQQLAAASGETLTNLQELCGLTKDCYAQLQMQLGRYSEAKRNFADALALYSEIHGREQPEVVSLLNNLAVVCTSLDDLVAAEVYITEALQLARKFPDLYDSGVYQANHGMLLMKQGLLAEAQRVCTAAWRSAKRANSALGVEQSDHCLQELKRMRLG